MIVSADLSEELTTKLDALVVKHEPPVWPFPTTTILPDTLSASERKVLDNYRLDHAAYELSLRDASRPRSRSAAVKMILTEYFLHNGNGTKK